MKYKASIIILNYFGEKVIAQTLDSVTNQNYPKDKYEILVPDNASSDHSRQIITEYSKKYPQIKPLFLKKNLGFAAGNNYAIKKSSSEYVVLLNNDCLVDKNWLKNLINTADHDKKIFSVGSKIKLHPTSKNVIQNAGSLVFQDGYGRDIGAVVTFEHQQLYETDLGQFNQVKEVYSTCGAAVLYRRSILDTIGLLDDTFFMYYEDTEIAERARLCGYKNIYCPQAVVYHNHAQSSKEWSPFFIYHAEKGRLLHVLYHFPLKIFFQQYLKFTIKSILRFFKSEEKNKSWQYLKVVFYYLTNLPKLLIKRSHFSYSSSARNNNYQKIISGFWYF